MPARADIVLEVKAPGAALGVDARVSVADPALRSDARLFIAFVDSRLHSDVRAGENRGVRLTHDHVVRSLQSFGPVGRDGTLAVRADIERPCESGVAPAIVAFVQRTSNGDVLQSLELPLFGCGT